ncbi:amidohydrolase [Thalassotalea euphylliae]|uniref:Amidohydrolase n=2 Tax=Thalassotalea euphylliae TaxID=1655234 RepID=A0A3E0TPT3_9GAMM|nr:amidohydrolase [Thalassotalea euphylliae]
MRIIDPHLHLFDLDCGDYSWLKPENPPYWPDKQIITRNFDCSALTLEQPFSLAGFVHIEAGFDNNQPWREIAWLEKTVSLPFKSVATIDLSAELPSYCETLAKLNTFSSVVGVRHILDESAEAILEQANIIEKFNMLANLGLHFELQLSLADSAAQSLLSAILDRVPNLRIMINHAGWPSLDITQDTSWQAGVQRLARYDNIAIKCSGWEMTARDYCAHWQQQVIDYAIACFGRHRVMLASNFPLSLFSNSYQALWQGYCDILKQSHLSNEVPNKVSNNVPSEVVNQLCFENAYTWYGFNSQKR